MVFKTFKAFSLLYKKAVWAVLHTGLALGLKMLMHADFFRDVYSCPVQVILLRTIFPVLDDFVFID